MNGQMSLFDFLKPEKKKKCGDDDPPCAWKDEYAPCDTCTREKDLPKQKGECASCKWMFWKHTGGRGERGCEYHGGKDGCHYERRKTCRTCGHMQKSVCGMGEVYHGFACFGFGIAKSQDINGKACMDYEEATDGEAWRTDDEVVKEWMEYERQTDTRRSF